MFSSACDISLCVVEERSALADFHEDADETQNDELFGCSDTSLYVQQITSAL